MSTSSFQAGDGVSLRLKSDPRYLCLIRSLVRTFGSLAGFDDARSGAIALAVDESCTNIIRHAYGGRADGEVELEVRLRDDGEGSQVLVIRLTDWGLPVPASCLSDLPPRDPLTPGGLGLHLIRCIMDGVRFDQSSQGANVMELSIACPSPSGRCI
jgi:anti-sigma regulatory factor (Ser/Thr protein kinase)